MYRDDLDAEAAFQNGRTGQNGSADICYGETRHLGSRTRLIR